MKYIGFERALNFLKDGLSMGRAGWKPAKVIRLKKGKYEIPPDGQKPVLLGLGLGMNKYYEPSPELNQYPKFVMNKEDGSEIEVRLGIEDYLSEDWYIGEKDMHFDCIDKVEEYPDYVCITNDDFNKVKRGSILRFDKDRTLSFDSYYHYVSSTDNKRYISFDDITNEYDATYLSIGAHADKKIGIEGEDAKSGITSAVEMLRAIGDGDMPDYTGKKVIVIGGGNVAMDVARSSIRLGASKVSIVYRRRKADMTALEEEVEGAEAEGCDVLELMSPVRIKQDEDGNAIGLIVKPQMISRVSHGRPAPKAAAKDEILLESDLIVVAIGQGIETKSFEEHGIKVQRGVISALNTGNITPQDGEMSEGVFAGGDCVTGPATVIKAIAAGKVAAANIDEYLGFNHEITCDVEIPYASNEDKVACGRVEVALRDAAERKNDFEPIEYGFSCEEACQEAGRCLRCDHFGFGAFRGGREEQW